MVRKKALIECSCIKAFYICQKLSILSWSAAIIIICWQITLEWIKYKSWLSRNIIGQDSIAMSKAIWKIVTFIWLQKQWDINCMMTCNCYQYQPTNRKIYLWILTLDYKFIIIRKAKHITQSGLSLTRP